VKRPGFLSKLFTSRFRNSVAHVKTEVAAFPSWDPLLQAVWERASILEENEIFMFQLQNRKLRLLNRDNPTLIIGRLKRQPNQSLLDHEFFVTAMGLVSDGVVPGSEDLSWQRIGFQVEQTRQTKSFGTGPVTKRDLNAVLVSALDVFHVFYGVSMESRIRNAGDEVLEELLSLNRGIKRVRTGVYGLRR
jgi:hypothetical protein